MSDTQTTASTNQKDNSNKPRPAKPVHPLPRNKVDRLLKVKPIRMGLLDVWRIMREFVKGFKFIRKYNRAVTFFGSARCGFDYSIYQEARKLAHGLAQEGFAVVTGGGPGIMQAANHGAYDANGQSIGLNIVLPTEQRTNPFVKESIGFSYFFSRKVMLMSVSQLYVYFPGGYGTMDELFELLTLVQTKKANPVTIILVGRRFWEPLLEWMKQVMYEENQAIDAADLKLFFLVDTADEALAHVNMLIRTGELIPSRKHENWKFNPHGEITCAV